MLIAPLLVTLALKIRSLVGPEEAPAPIQEKIVAEAARHKQEEAEK